MSLLFSTAEGTYYNWKKQNRPIVSLLEKYFTKEDLEEYLESGKWEKMEDLKKEEEELVENLKRVLKGLT